MSSSSSNYLRIPKERSSTTSAKLPLHLGTTLISLKIGIYFLTLGTVADAIIRIVVIIVIIVIVIGIIAIGRLIARNNVCCNIGCRRNSRCRSRRNLHLRNRRGVVYDLDV